MPSRFRPALIRPCALAALILMSPLSALGQPAPGGAQGQPKSVGIVTAEVSDVPQIVTLPGRAVAYEVATVRPRVGGLIEAITYEPGRMIEAGAPMFQLETATLDAALDAARATELGATQARDNAQATVERYTALENRGVTRADLQAAEVALTQAEAQLVTAQTARQAAQLERDRAVIPAPISGYTDETSATIGSLVTANQADALATITRIDPIYVDLAASSAKILEGRQQVQSGVMTRIDPPRIELLLEDGTTYDQSGEVVSAGSTVSATTGTVALRVKFNNPDRMILPGQFLRVHMTIGTMRAVLVPQRATSRLADGSLVAFVLEDGKAARKVLTAAGVANNSWAVTDGIVAGDQVIVDGLSNLNDGQAVSAVAVTLDERGVVVAPEGGTEQPWAAAPPPAAQAEAQPGLLARLRGALGLGGDEAEAAPAASSAAAPVAASGTGAGTEQTNPPPAAPPAAAQAPAPASTPAPTPAAQTAPPAASQGG